MALKSKSGYELVLHQRSSEVGTYPNAIAVAPNFGMEPIMHEAIPNLSFGNETGN